MTKKHTRSTPVHDEVNDRLRAIYGDDTRDLHTVEQSSPAWQRFFVRIVISLVSVAIIAAAGFFIYAKFFFFGGGNESLHIAIDVPSEITSGQNIDITINYQNPNKRPLAQLSFEARLPPGFTPETTTPEPTDKDRFVWNIGTFGGKSDGKIVLHGRQIGEVGKTTGMQVIATYRPANFNADFTQIASASSTIKNSIISIASDGPHDAIAGSPATYRFTLNTQDLPTETFLQETTISCDLPKGFSVTSSDPAFPDGSIPQWSLDKLVKGQNMTFALTGVYANDAADVGQVGAVVKFMQAAAQTVQASTSTPTNITKNPLQVTILVNGASQNADIDLGNSASVSVEIENGGTEKTSPNKLLLDFQPEHGIPILWKQAQLDGGRLTQEGIVFDATLLGTLAPGDKKIFHISLPTADMLGPTDVESFSVLAHVSEGELSFTASPVAIRLIGSLTSSASAAFYDESGAPIGEGALPPSSGKTTTYVITWGMKSSLHAVENVTHSASLPVGVTFGQERSCAAGSIAYDETTRIVRWSLDRLEENSQQSCSFSVIVLPEDADVGTFMKILGSTASKAIDAVTGSFISSSVDALTTDLLGQKGGGVVAQ